MTEFHGFPKLFCFNPRTRTGCDKSSNSSPGVVLMFQSTHPHGVRRGKSRAKARASPVSIHAPARGATKFIYDSYACIDVSIHAPARGATKYAGLLGHQTLRFNPRTRTGCDQSTDTTGHGLKSFNPRTRTGCDEAADSPGTGTMLFQSTHPHGVRQMTWLIKTVQCMRFNPRTRTGCDGNVDAGLVPEAMFQSTHPHGVRPAN